MKGSLRKIEGDAKHEKFIEIIETLKIKKHKQTHKERKTTANKKKTREV